MDKKIVLFCNEGTSSSIVLTELKSKFNILGIVIDEPLPRLNIIKRRIKRLGLLHVINQLLFQTIIVPILRFESLSRAKQILNNITVSNLNNFDDKILYSNINDAAVLSFVNRLKPDIIVVNGTRIISKKILSQLSIPIINLHVGITPKYRGVHGGYWAIASNDKQNCGVTIHRVDSGIDTGSVLYQKSIEYTSKDNFCTYPLLQTILGAKGLVEVIINEAKEISSKNLIDSKLYYHPTFTSYVKSRVLDGVK